MPLYKKVKAGGNSGRMHTEKKIKVKKIKVKREKVEDKMWRKWRSKHGGSLPGR